MRAERVFEPDHPASRGHFEGNPIIPGAVLLSEALRAIAGDAAPLELASVKFLHPVRPGDRVLIEYARSGLEVKFTCTVSGRTVLAGQVRCPA